MGDVKEYSVCRLAGIGFLLANLIVLVDATGDRELRSCLSTTVTECNIVNIFTNIIPGHFLSRCDSITRLSKLLASFFLFFFFFFWENRVFKKKKKKKKKK